MLGLKNERNTMIENVFTVLGIQSREDCVSNALAYVFNVSVPFRRVFLRQICGKDPDLYSSAKAFTRVSTGAPGIPDIVLSLEGESCADLVVIENKIKADEGDDQTVRYASKEAIVALSDRLLPGKAIGEPAFIFMTLFPDQQPAAQDKYTVHRHSELKAIAAGINDWGNDLARQLINDWLVLTGAFYDRQNVTPSDIFFNKLTDDNGLDDGYLYFRMALGQLNFPPDLDLEEFFRSSQQGRHYYGARISKDSWHPGEMKKLSGSWILDPTTDYNIHLEPQYNVLSGVFNCFLHYEVSPYKPEKWVKANIPSDQYTAYLARRMKFATNLQKQELPGWSFGGGSNQIAKTTFDFSKSSYAEVKATLEREIARMAQAIDSVLHEK